MLINIHGAKCIGIDAVPVTIEVDINRGIGIHLVGLADAAVKESLLRTVTALQSLGFRVPGKKIVINLAPADMHKNGSGYDLPIALGIIAASGQCEMPALENYLLMGELGLDGSLREVPGSIPMAELAIRTGLKGCILPVRSAAEAADYKDIDIYAASTLTEVLGILSGSMDAGLLNVRNNPAASCFRDAPTSPDVPEYMDFSEIVGQEAAKRGMEIAAAGAHNILMIGAPGSGKSSLAKALPGILPPMSTEESIVTSKIYSVSSDNKGRYGLIRERPFRAPHHSASLVSLIGGGSGNNILPGEVSLAHNGVLFLDEVAQIPKSVIEALRAPLEDRKVTVSRLRSKVVYPASFMLVAASNPCPCGYYGEGDRCVCTVGQQKAYLARLSGPIMDRIDIQLWLHRVPAEKLVNPPVSESSADVARRVWLAREAQKERFRGTGIFSNAEMNGRQIKEFCPLDDGCRGLMEKITGRMGLSARAFSRVVKLARTIADLEWADEAVNGGLPPARPCNDDAVSMQSGGVEGNLSDRHGLTPENGTESQGGHGLPTRPGPIKPKHLAEAAGYRFLDKMDF